MQTIDSRLIRVFISSTFRDMQDERDELMKKTFPVLRRKAAERDVTLTELDLRWGITPEESQSGKVVEICLREIENSEPFFVGIIGNRYGWIPSADDLGESLRERFTQVDGYVERRLSVTEMEMQFGVLERPENIHSYFFIKEQEENDVDEPEKLATLKNAVRTNGRYPVSTYSSPEDLAQQVEEAFTKLLDELFPEGALSELEKERIGQRSYLNSLCQSYIRTDANFAVIDDWMSDWNKHQLVITGASGLGKSALVANWIKEKLTLGDTLPYRIIYHFVGNGGSLGSHGHVAKALCDEIRERYDFADEEREDKTDEKALEELFNLVAAEGDKPLLIVLDAINQIIDTDNAKQLNWLPIPPKYVKILFTTLEDDRTMEVFKNRHYPVFTLQPLTKMQREEMVFGYLHLYSKKLQPYQVECIVSDEQCENTLVLKTFLDELVNFGIFEKLDEKISTYLGTESIDDFYKILLKNYENDFGEPFVKHILSLIAVSRNGLSEEEILAITHETPLHWSRFFCSIRQHLIVKNGLISFAHSYIRKAVENRYLAGHKDWEDNCRREIVALLKDTKSHRAMDEVPYQYNKLEDLSNLYDYLMDLGIFEYLYESDEAGLGKYWLYMNKSDVIGVKGYLAEVDRCEDSKRTSILMKLSAFTRNTVVNPALSQQFIEKAFPYVSDEKEKADVFNLLGLSYGLSGNHQKALEYEEKALQIRLAIFGEQHPAVAQSFNNVGGEYSKLGDHKKALEYEEKALQIRLSVFGERHPDVALSFNNVGGEYIELGEYKKALEYMEKAFQIYLSVFAELHPDVARSYNTVGYAYSKLGNHPKALKYIEKALQIRVSIFGDRHPDVARSYNTVGFSYSNLGNHLKALEYMEKALQILLSIFGDNHPDVAISYHNVGNEYGALGDHLKALEYKEKALQILLLIFEEHHPTVASAYSSVGYEYGKLGDYQKALEYKEKALQIRLSIFGERHPDVANSYNNVGSEYGELGDHRKALEYKEKALQIRLSIFGERHPAVATSYNDVGHEYSELGDFRKALEFQEKALQIRLSIFGENHPDVATSYDNVGTEYSYLGDHRKALEYMEKALQIYLSVFGENHPDVAVSYNNVGCVCSELGDHRKGLEYEEKALQIRLSIFGENHPDVAHSYNNVGSEYGELRDHQKALEYKETALKILLSIFGEQHPDVATSYNNVGSEYVELGDYKKALEYMEKALQIRLSIFGEQHPDVATSYNNVGYGYGELGDHQKALEYMEKALQIRLSIFGENHPYVATSYNNVGSEYGALGDPEQELEYRSKALEIAHALKNESMEATLHNRLGKTYEIMEMKDKAREEYKLAADMFTAMGNEEESAQNQSLYDSLKA